MIQYRDIIIPNGDMMVPFTIYTCEICGKEVGEDIGGVIKNDAFYCGDCAFINGVISEDEYIKERLYWVPKPCHVEIIGGEVEIFCGKRKPYAKKDRRNSPEYKIWRDKVFKRDKYTCQECGTVGGELNDHHIKPYKKHKELRLSVSNGVTLCYSCHKKTHGKN